MKELYLDTHAFHCPCNSNEVEEKLINFCSINPERFLFFLGTKFYIITYNPCIEFGDKYNLKKNLIDKIIKDNKIFDLYEVNRGVDLQKDLINFRIRNKSLRKYIEQVNFIYEDNRRKKYAITTRTRYLDSICNNEEIEENYKIAKQMLIDNEYNWLLNSLDELYYANKIYNEPIAEYHKSIEHIINTITKLTK